MENNTGRREPRCAAENHHPNSAKRVSMATIVDNKKLAYGLKWNLAYDDLAIELAMIRHGGRWTKNGKEHGEGLFYHYRRAQNLAWPEEDDHRWSDLILKTILDERITVIQGSKDSGKTHGMSKFALIDYWSFPDETLILMSSTDIRGLELRVWGDIKNLFNSARDRFSWLPGNVVDAKHGIFTDGLGEDAEIRDMRKGIICIPCIGGNGEWVGLQKYVGIKQKRRRLLGDECQFLRPAYMDSLSNLDKGDFKGAFAGNPLGQGDPLDKMAEPVGGWDSVGDVVKTTTWKNKFGGVTVNLVGIDSPNFDEPRGSNPKYPYMIAPEDADRVALRWGKDSVQYYSQIMGVRKPGLNAHRVLTREMCLRFGAFEDVIWSGKPTTRVYGIDASYGGDRCVGGFCEFGEDVNNIIVFKVHPPVVIPILVKSEDIPEDQIANFVRADCDKSGIPPSNVFYDSTGRGSLGTSFGRLWSTAVNPVEFGGTPTTRPVCHDIYVFDDRTKERRLKRCDEHYSKRVSEYWFSVRYTVESRQLRCMPQDVLDEFTMREWTMVKSDKIEIESKIDTKERMGCSPDLADWLAICVEGARRLGFRIERLTQPDGIEQETRWLSEAMDRHKRFVRKTELSYQ